MICQRALSLLDDFLDNELAESVSQEVKSHLDQCGDCRREFEESRRLKELLKQKGTRDPGEDYWLETSQLVLAKTVQQSGGYESYASSDTEADSKGPFLQALVSLAASLVILASAVIVGMNQGHAPDAGVRGGPILFSSSAGRQLNATHSIMTNDERQRLAKGMLIMGPPGLLGHFGGLTELRMVITPEHH
ncbi:MAG: zf-HC2 domain-containing protein [candidate division Zixibacteria bacterium]|nr:zf-HC2 domain-containing protein [candidate division Zixibacteria bacterium]MDH3936001.1 zf-HC2 domain-containing protein [candidate division Zixibacteria bacterium]MDH4033977.1 zf-HC2 domain-containing protein [candidate division Zixibacteria bacterium]